MFYRRQPGEGSLYGKRRLVVFKAAIGTNWLDIWFCAWILGTTHWSYEVASDDYHVRSMPVVAVSEYQ